MTCTLGSILLYYQQRQQQKHQQKQRLLRLLKYSIVSSTRMPNVIPCRSSIFACTQGRKGIMTHILGTLRVRMRAHLAHALRERGRGARRKAGIPGSSALLAPHKCGEERPSDTPKKRTVSCRPPTKMASFEKMPWWRQAACGLIVVFVVFSICFLLIAWCKDKRRQVR